MKNVLVGIMIILLSLISHSKQIRVAVIDTGLDISLSKAKLCKTGHYDVSRHRKGLFGDAHVGKHGTNVANAIASIAKDADYCLLIYNVYKKSRISYRDVSTAVDMAQKNGAIALNLSFGGRYFSRREYNSLKRASDNGMIMFVAAGNSNSNLDIKCNYFPACYKLKSMAIVGALDGDEKLFSSNYGSVISIWENSTFGDMKGTSQATGIATGKFIKYVNGRSK